MRYESLKKIYLEIATQATQAFITALLIKGEYINASEGEQIKTALVMAFLTCYLLFKED